LEHFEKRYIDYLDYQEHNETIKLVGFKTVKIPLHRQTEFEELYNTNAYNEEYVGYRSAYYDFETASLRIYFPVAGALVEHDGELIEASELGEFDVDDIQGDYHVKGRYQTDKVHGHEGNIIQDGIVYLGKPCPPSHRHGKVHIYDFGLKSLDDDHSGHSHHQRRQDEEENGEGSEDQQPNRGCIKNHGGINCSKAYGIDNGRCEFNPNTCMDYNGYLSNVLGDCKKEDKYLYFVGSDCFDSVADGNCWNEMVSAEDEGE
jgi:hypothetical protein